ncbi:MAG TPA: antibiotic biosynthesis monooxygenase family protein [Candidatus Limnocylindrales bacterium]
MIERHISFAVLPDKTADFERFFVEQYRPPVLQMPGLIECSLLREAEHADRYQMVFRWETAENAAAWRTSEVHQGLQPALNALHTGMDIVALSKIA